MTIRYTYDPSTRAITRHDHGMKNLPFGLVNTTDWRKTVTFAILADILGTMDANRHYRAMAKEFAGTINQYMHWELTYGDAERTEDERAGDIDCWLAKRREEERREAFKKATTIHC